MVSVLHQCQIMFDFMICDSLRLFKVLIFTAVILRMSLVHRCLWFICHAFAFVFSANCLDNLCHGYRNVSSIESFFSVRWDQLFMGGGVSFSGCPRILYTRLEDPSARYFCAKLSHSHICMVRWFFACHCFLPNNELKIQLNFILILLTFLLK